ncbi:MAG: hypothetical protein ACYS0I_10600 [Planctomycetota bacterium]|jgi:hypothetical protein
MSPRDNIEKLISELILHGTDTADKHILNDALAAYEKSNSTESANLQPKAWRIIMKSKITKYAAAAVIIIAVLLTLNIFHQSMPTASAAEVLDSAAKALTNLKSVYITARMRAPGGGDNLRTIGIDYNFVPIQIWKVFDGGIGKWRIECPARVIVSDGNTAKQLCNSTWATERPAYDSIGWFPLNLVDVDRIIGRELIIAQQHGSYFELFEENGENGLTKMVVMITATAQGDFTNDYLKNKSFEMSDNTRIYTFDAETKLLENLRMYINTEVNDVLVFEMTKIEYNTINDFSVFDLQFPENVIWWQKAEILPDNEKYQQMTPKETAEAFFEACANEDWDEYLKFNPASDVSTGMKQYLGGLEIISIGEPFKSGLYPGWFVPYEIKLKSGQIKKHNLALRNDNQAERYVVDGGI